MSYKVKYTLRKSRKMRALMPVMLGAIIGSVALNVHTAHASEEHIVKTDNPATNAIEAQPHVYPQAEESHKKEHQAIGQINVVVDNKVLTQAIDKANAQHLQIIETPVIHHETTSTLTANQQQQKNIESDYQQQAKMLEKDIVTYEQQNKYYHDQLDKINQENNDKQHAYEQQITNHHRQVTAINQANQQAQQNYQQQLDKYHQEVAKIDAYNQQQSTKYQQDYQNYLHNKDAIEQQNQQHQTAYNQRLQQYQQKLEEYNKNKQRYTQEITYYDNELQKIKQQNDEKLKKYQLQRQEYQQKQQTVDHQNSQALKAYQQKVDKAKKAIQEGMKNPKNIHPISGDQQQYSDTQSWTNLQSSIIDNDIHIVASGQVNQVEDLQNGRYSVHVYSDTDGKITNANIIKSIHWGDVDIIGNAVSGDKITESYQAITGLDNALYNVMTGNTTKVFSVKSGEWFTIPQAVSLANNDKKDLLVKLTKSGTPLTYGADWITVWNANGAINYYDGSHALSEEAPADQISATYKIADTSDKYLWTAATFDIDGGQYMTLHTKDSAIVSIGGGLKLEDKNIYSDEQLGYTWGKNSNANALDGTNSTPDGVMVFTEFANEISHTLSNTLGGNSTSVANADFGTSVNVSVAEYPILLNKVDVPKEPQLQQLPAKPQTFKLTPPEQPQPHKIEPQPLVPQKPIPKKYPTKPQQPGIQPLPKEPVKPKYQVLPKKPKTPQLNYHYHQLATQPKIYKNVTNPQNMNINDALIPKLSEVHWHLNTETLPANREPISQYIFTDYLPSGFALDLLTTQTLNDQFNLTFNQTKNLLQLQAKPDYLSQLNHDLKTEITPITPVVVGKVLNDGATYINNFKLQMNNYTHYSNNVQVTTPGKVSDPKHPHNNLIQPIKYNKNPHGIIINDKEVLAGSTNYYHLIWDLDQYKDIKATDKAIEQGFYFIDDYPEDVLLPLENGILIQDNLSQPVKDISITKYSNISEAPENIQKTLTQANIHPEGAFQVFSANHPNEFYHQYVKQGRTLTIINPMKVDASWKEKGVTYHNRAYQIDFGNGYATEIVNNHTPAMSAHKDVVVEINDKDSLDGKQVDLNQAFYYHLTGTLLPQNRADVLTQYDFIDQYDDLKDEYTKMYHVYATQDLQLYDGTKIKQGEEVTQYTTSKHQDHEITINFNKEFLINIDRDSQVQFDVYLKMIRIDTGEVENKFINRVNGVDVISNIVNTHTPKPSKKTAMLPKTGIATLPTKLLGFCSLILTMLKIKKQYN